jgi:hypothetical protein
MGWTGTRAQYQKGENMSAAEKTFSAPARILDSFWGGDQSQFDKIKQAQTDALKSEWNTASVTQQGADYYNKSAEAYAKARLAAEQGMTPEEMSLATNENAQQMNFAAQNANRIGGNGSAYINSVLNAGNNKFALDLSAQNQAIKRQNQQTALAYLNNLGGASNVYQDVNNMNFQKQTMTEQALGQAESDWYANRDANKRALISAAASVAGSVAGAAGSAAGAA